MFEKTNIKTTIFNFVLQIDRRKRVKERITLYNGVCVWGGGGHILQDSGLYRYMITTGKILYSGDFNDVT